MRQKAFTAATGRSHEFTELSMSLINAIIETALPVCSHTRKQRLTTRTRALVCLVTLHTPSCCRGGL